MAPARATEPATKIITKASIGVNYDENFIFVAFSTKNVKSHAAEGDGNSNAIPEEFSRLGGMSYENEDYAQRPIVEWTLVHIASDGHNTSDKRICVFISVN